MNAIHGADGEQGDFEIKLNHTFDNHAPGTGAATLLRIVPGLIQRATVADKALPFTGGAHYRLNDARVANLVDGLKEFGFVTSKTVAGGGELQLFSRQTANTFTVHGQLRRFCTGHYALTFLLKGNQHIGSNGFDFRYHEIRFFFGNQGVQGVAIQHVNHMSAVGYVHRRGICITINRDDFNA